MLERNLTKDAFARPAESKNNIIQDYKSLYGDEAVVRSFIKEEKVDFIKQFHSLMDKLKEWGRKHDCIATEIELHNFEERKAEFFNENYAGNKPAEFINTIKQNLESIWFILEKDNNTLLAKKKTVFTHFCNHIHVCAPGLYTHIEDTLHALTIEISLAHWLAELRTNIILIYAQEHVKKYHIHSSSSIHVFNAFLKEAGDKGWNPLGDMDKNPDQYANPTFTQITPEILKEFQAYFIQQYTPQAIVECICTNFIYELTRIRKSLSINEEKDSWVSTAPEFLKKVNEISAVIGLEEIGFYECSEDGMRMRLDRDFLMRSFLKSCKDKGNLFPQKLWIKKSFPNDCILFYMQEQNLYWMEGVDGILNWRRPTEEPELRILLGEFLLALEDEQEIDFLLRHSVGDLTNFIKSPRDLYQLLIPVKNKKSLPHIIKNGIKVENLNVILKDSNHICQLLNLFPTKEHWKLAGILAYCRKDYILNSVQRGDFESFKKLTKGNKLFPYNFERKGKALLLIAVQNGHVDFLRLLIDEYEIGLDTTDKNGWPLAHSAAIHNQPEIIKALFQYGIDLNQPAKKRGSTPALIAAAHGHVAVIKSLAECRTNLDTPCQFDRRPQHVAAYENKADVLRALAEYKVDLNAVATKQKITPAYYAVRYGHVESVKALVELRADFTKADIDGKTPLHIAIQIPQTPQTQQRTTILLMILGLSTPEENESDWPLPVLAAKQGNFQALRMLQECHYVANESNKDGNTAAHLAALHHHSHLIHFFAKHNVNLTRTNNDGSTPAAIAAMRNDANFIYALFKNRVDLSLPCLRGSATTVAHVAAQSNSLQVIKELIALKVDILWKRDQLGKTPLDLAAANSHLELVLFLLSMDPTLPKVEGRGLVHDLAFKGYVSLFEKNCLDFDINAVDKLGWTPLHLAVASGQEAFVKMLWAQPRINLNAFDKDGNAPLHLALVSKHMDMARRLLERPECINLPNQHGRTPAHFAAQDGNLDLCKFLLAFKANFKLRDKEGVTAIQLAQANKYFEIVSASLQDAAMRGDDELIKIAAECKVDLNLTFVVKRLESLSLYAEHNLNRVSLFHKAVEYGSLKVIKMLAAYRADIDQASSEDSTPLSQAMYSGYIDRIQELIDCKADVNKQDKAGRTVIYKYFRADGSNEGVANPIVKLLVENKADLNIPDDTGEPILHYIIKYRRIEAAKIMLECKADVNKPDRLGNPILHYFLRNSEFETAKMLVELKADFSQGKTDLTALTRELLGTGASTSSLLNGVTSLVDSKVDFTKSNSLGKTPLGAAVESKNVPGLAGMLMFVSNIKNISVEDLQFIKTQRGLLADWFINLAKNMCLEQRMQAMRQILNSENALGMILNTPSDHLHNFFRTKIVRHGLTEKVFRIVTALEYDLKKNKNLEKKPEENKQLSSKVAR